MTVSNDVTADGSVQTRSRDRFFLSMSGLLLLILLIGFSRTLYLRLFFEVPPIPSYLHVHGATVTAWFVWLIVQASLVNVNRVDVHRRIGMLGAVIGVALIPAGLMATLQFVPRLPEIGFSFEQAPWFVTWIAWTNFHMLEQETTFVTMAWLLLVVPILVYDLATSRRIHSATAIGGLCFLLVVFGPILIAGTDFAQNFVRGLG